MVTHDLQANAAEDSEIKTVETPAKKESTNGDHKVWAAPDSDPPAKFYDTPLVGEQWQIAWALKLAGILTRRGTPKELCNKLEKKTTLWGKRAKREHYVYIAVSWGPERLEQALQELKEIKARPYHPPTYRLPERYEKHQAHPLKAGTEEVLAEVLHEVGELEHPTVSCLRDTIADGGRSSASMTRAGSVCTCMIGIRTSSSAKLRASFKKSWLLNDREGKKTKWTRPPKRQSSSSIALDRP